MVEQITDHNCPEDRSREKLKPGKKLVPRRTLGPRYRFY